VIQDDCEREGEEMSQEGCTDPEACNYDPDATIDDGSCEYIELFDIIGNTNPAPLSEEGYFYTSTAGSTYQWSASNGAITAGQGTASVTVIWGESGAVSISVTETDEEGCEGDTVILEFEIVATSVFDLNAESIKVYPNPASSYLVIESEETGFENSTIRLIDSKGRLVLNSSMQHGNKLDISMVASGVYTLKLISDQNMATVQVIIQR
jgi:hypothetical protein